MRIDWYKTTGIAALIGLVLMVGSGVVGCSRAPLAPGATPRPYSGISGVETFRDAVNGVTCYLYVGHGIDCISDAGAE